MRKLLFLLFVGIAISLTSCRKDFAFEPSSGGLEFSKDTVYLDTVFTNIGSSTYRLKVYNRSDKDISIPSVQLGKGLNSKYRIMVDGMSGNGKIFKNVELLAKDSMFVFIEVTADVASANPTDFLYTDQIQFTNVSGASQNVELVTLIQDAYFIYPQRTLNTSNHYEYEGVTLGLNDENKSVTIAGNNLDENDPINGNEFIWNNSKPYVIYGYAHVPDGKMLTVQEGARIHFHANSGLIIAKDGRLFIDGKRPSSDNSPTNLSKEVLFEGDRLESQFSDVPGQWGAIINYSTRSDNVINHLTLKNASVGIYCYNLANVNDNEIPKITINDSQIYNCSNVGILARKAAINGKNIVINYCGEASLACTFGGTYEFKHCTFNNNWNSSKQAAVLLTDYYETTTSYITRPFTANFTNCIIYGSNQVEYLVDRKGNDTINQFNYNFSNCLIKFYSSSDAINALPYYSFANFTNFPSCKIATTNSLYNPKFKSENNNKLWPTEDLSLSIPTIFLVDVPNDILDKTRTPNNTIGAYQFIAN